jgi:hypothetical protein
MVRVSNFDMTLGMGINHYGIDSQLYFGYCVIQRLQWLTFFILMDLLRFGISSFQDRCKIGNWTLLTPFWNSSTLPLCVKVVWIWFARPLLVVRSLRYALSIVLLFSLLHMFFHGVVCGKLKPRLEWLFSFGQLLWARSLP